MSDEELNDLSSDIEGYKERRKFFAEWLEGYRKAHEIAPFMQMNFELTDWIVRAFEERPEEADEIPYIVDPEKIKQENRYLRLNFPPPQVPNTTISYNSTGVTISGTADVYEHLINRVGQIPTERAQDYARRFSVEYMKLQEKQERPKEVRSLLENLKDLNILERFDDTCRVFWDFQNQTGTRESAANHMRNLIAGVFGNLKNIALRWPNENMNWEIMADHLAIDGNGSIFFRNLINQGEKRSRLLGELADVLKDMEGKKYYDLEDLWTRTLDHIYVVLTSVNI